MADSLVMSGTIIVGPTAAGDCDFPNAITNMGFKSHPNQKIAAKNVKQSRELTDASTYVTLEGVGSTAAVKQGTFLFVQSEATMKIRITTNPDSGGDVVSEIPVKGTLVIEFPDANYLKLVEAKGVGVLEYFASGSA